MGGGNTETNQSHTADEEVALSGVKEFISFHFHLFISREKKKRKYSFFLNSSNCTYTCKQTFKGFEVAFVTQNKGGRFLFLMREFKRNHRRLIAMHSLPNLRVCPFNSARVTFIAFSTSFIFTDND